MLRQNMRPRGTLVTPIPDSYICVYTTTIYICTPVLLGYSFNPLTTNDECTSHPILAACYQLVQSILEIGSVLAEGVG